jgi:hypothetical protein
MADQLYLSYWLRGFSEGNMLRKFERLLRTFPFSVAATTLTTLRIYAIEFAEPPLLEVSFAAATGPEEIVATATQFQNADCAFMVGGSWDLWQRDNGWQLSPAGVVLSCYGPQFQNETDDHLRLELGLDSHFLPPPGQAVASGKVRSNIRSLLRLSQDLDGAFPVARRLLWTESGENFAEKLRETIAVPGL